MLKYLVAILLTILIFKARADELRVGDVLLQPLDCQLCSMIEEEEETIFSHMGLVVAVSPEVLVAEAYGTVKTTPLKEFAAKTEAGQKIAILRYQNAAISTHIERNQADLVKTFSDQFNGHAYDRDFLWNNFDENGAEKFYCSEMVTKLLQSFMRLEVPVKRMHFKTNRDQWEQYFNGNVPDGKWGNSPGDFLRSDLFYLAGEL